MYRKFRKIIKRPISTYQLEQSLDQSYASLQSQMELLDKMQHIFGEHPQDPIIKFQMSQLKEQLGNDIKRIALSGTDIHHIQEKIGAELIKAQVLQARKTIDEDRKGKQPLTDMINDDQFADEYSKQIYKQLESNPFAKKELQDYILQTKLQDPSRLELQNIYMMQGMPYEQAYNKSIQNVKLDNVRLNQIQITSLLNKLPKEEVEKLGIEQVPVEENKQEEELKEIPVQEEFEELKEEQKEEQKEDIPQTKYVIKSNLDLKRIAENIKDRKKLDKKTIIQIINQTLQYRSAGRKREGDENPTPERIYNTIQELFNSDLSKDQINQSIADYIKGDDQQNQLKYIKNKKYQQEQNPYKQIANDLRKVYKYSKDRQEQEQPEQPISRTHKTKIQSKQEFSKKSGKKRQ